MTDEIKSTSETDFSFSSQAVQYKGLLKMMSEIFERNQIVPDIYCFLE